MPDGKSIKYGKLEVMVGNLKLDTDTLIFNMGSAAECPAMKLGKCKLGKDCYALTPETHYPKCKPYRDRQAAYWLNHSTERIIADFDNMLRTKRVKIDPITGKLNGKGKLVPLHNVINYFRFNEAGDFYTQADVRKLSTLALHLKREFNIDTYGYTAMDHLDYSKRTFTVKGSGWNGPDGKTIARKLAKVRKHIEPYGTYRENVKRYFVCPSDCRTCHTCKAGRCNVVFIKHGKGKKTK